jgi:hypothetical protein
MKSYTKVMKDLIKELFLQPRNSEPLEFHRNVRFSHTLLSNIFTPN